MQNTEGLTVRTDHCPQGELTGRTDHNPLGDIGGQTTVPSGTQRDSAEKITVLSNLHFHSLTILEM